MTSLSPDLVDAQEVWDTLLDDLPELSSDEETAHLGHQHCGDRQQAALLGLSQGCELTA